MHGMNIKINSDMLNRLTMWNVLEDIKSQKTNWRDCLK